MKHENGKPMVGASRDMLGVVFGEPPAGDISANDDGKVSPGDGGMSVTKSWRDLPPGRIPKRLKHTMPDARGSNKYTCWVMGEADFISGPVADGLQLAVDSPVHGLVEPAVEMSQDEFQGHLAATQNLWQVIEEDIP